ncbi:MAG: hypothetical protein L3K03_00195 [Thermoplasmata archaeon]|nr:hypothetical protein [Thermoplasmata archaeon]
MKTEKRPLEMPDPTSRTRATCKDPPEPAARRRRTATRFGALGATGFGLLLIAAAFVSAAPTPLLHLTGPFPGTASLGGATQLSGCSNYREPAAAYFDQATGLFLGSAVDSARGCAAYAQPSTASSSVTLSYATVNFTVDHTANYSIQQVWELSYTGKLSVAGGSSAPGITNTWAEFELSVSWDIAPTVPNPHLNLPGFLDPIAEEFTSQNGTVNESAHHQIVVLTPGVSGTLRLPKGTYEMQIVVELMSEVSADPATPGSLATASFVLGNPTQVNGGGMQLESITIR